MKTTKLFFSACMMIAFVTFSNTAFSQSESNAKYVAGINQKIADIDQANTAAASTTKEAQALNSKLVDLKKELTAKTTELSSLADGDAKVGNLQNEIGKLLLGYKRISEMMTKTGDNKVKETK